MLYIYIYKSLISICCCFVAKTLKPAFFLGFPCNKTKHIVELSVANFRKTLENQRFNEEKFCCNSAKPKKSYISRKNRP